jgi:hypothetical protein
MNKSKKEVYYLNILLLSKTLSICQLKNLNEKDTLKCIKEKVGFIDENVLRVLLIAPFD